MCFPNLVSYLKSQIGSGIAFEAPYEGNQPNVKRGSYCSAGAVLRQRLGESS